MRSAFQRACEAGGRIIAPGLSPGIPGTFGSEPAKWATDDSSVRPRAANVQKVFCRPFGTQDRFYAVYPGLTPGATLCRRLRRLVVAILLTGVLLTVDDISASTASAQSNSNAVSDTVRAQQTPDASRYLDQA